MALDDAGQERWQVPLNALLRGACCPAAIPWRDGTVAILTTDGASSVVSDDDIEVVSADPLIVRQGRHLLRVDPVPGS